MQVYIFTALLAAFIGILTGYITGQRGKELVCSGLLAIVVAPIFVALVDLVLGWN